jgi:DNA-binding GntR family transcriptional regulator
MSLQKKSEKVGLENAAYRSILKLILKNQIKPGDFILETDFSKMLGMSRTPVRQALLRLIAEGFLEKKKKKGCIIPVPTPEDARQIFEAREIIETEVVKLAVSNATKNDIEEIKQTLRKENAAISSNNKEDYWLANEEFHFRLMESSKNIYLEGYCRNIFRRSSIYILYFDSFYSRDADSTNYRHKLSPKEHVGILEAIENKDSATAEILIKKHIRKSLEVLTGI